MSFTKVKTVDEIAAMRKSGKILATTLQFIKANTQAGMTTKDLSDMAAQKLAEMGGEPTFKGYNGYTDILCVSVNDEVVHGLPSKLVLKNGDLISIDFGVTYDGMVTDAALSYILGDASSQVKNLMKDTEASMYAGIDVLKDGVRVGDISSAIQKVLQRGGYGIVRDLVGHGVGHQMHEEPDIANYGFAGSGPVLRAGMTIAIEPMATLGTYAVTLDDDNWTVRTADGSSAAHFEHTVLITDRGYEILTQI
jgi:methionyl aminopeptidase